MEIIGFGDSWVAGHGVEIDERYSDVPNEKIPDDILKVRLNGSLISQLANKLGFTWKNYGLCGASNSEIYNSFVESLGANSHTDLNIYHCEEDSKAQRQG